MSLTSGRAIAVTRLDSTACTTNASSVGETGSATACAPLGSMSAPPPGGIARRPWTFQPGGTAPIARPDGVTSAEWSGETRAPYRACRRASRSCSTSRRLASTARAVAVATASECGCTEARSPVRSITPITSPVSGS